MTKSDTWPGGVAMESLSNMDSAGSCDSVISVNSGYSEDSMEHLSAEERACLMYLEETIEALEVQEDSGLSNDEPDPGLQAEETGRVRENDISSIVSDESGGDQKSFLGCGVPTALAHLPAEPGSRVLTTEDKAEQHALNQTSEPQSSAASAANAQDLGTSPNLVTQPKPPVAGCEINPSATPAEVLCSSMDGDGNLCPGQSTEAPEMDLGLIPPPSDFMDEPGLPPQPENVKDLPPSAGISNDEPGETELLREGAPAKTTSTSSSVTQEPPNKPPELSPLAVSSGPLLSPPPEAAEPRSPPAVAPKPKKLPANIILKSHKAAGADGNSGQHSVPATSERLLLDPQRVRIEALRKLGLLKSDESDSGPAPSSKLSPKTRRSWAAPLSPKNPAAPHTPPWTPSYTRVNSLPPASVPPSPAAVAPSGTATAPAVQPPDCLPAPAAFSDPDRPPLSDTELSAVKDVPEATVNARVNTPPLTPPALVKQPTPPKATGVKSASLERSGLGLSGYMASQDSSEAGQGASGKQSPGQLRNGRPRPASLGNGREFSSAQGEASQAGRAFQYFGDAQKLPRSQGISVLICPRAENGNDRREALKRLGLLRD